MKGKHSSNKITLFGIKNGKHSKNEIMVYNPIFSKFSACMSSFAVATSFLAVATLGKYRGTLAAADTARAAQYTLNLESANTSIAEFIPNTTRSITFQVKNFEGDLDNPTQKNEVKIKYRLNIEVPQVQNLPLEYKLYRITNNGANQTEIKITEGQTPYIDVAMTSEIHEYRLDFVWQNGVDNIIYGNLTDNVKISIDAEQVD